MTKVNNPETLKLAEGTTTPQPFYQRWGLQSETRARVAIVENCDLLVMT